MSRLDVMKSLLRDAGERVVRVGAGSPLRKKLTTLFAQRLFVSDERLTAAVARAPDVLAATVSTKPGLLRVDVSYADGKSLLMSITPLSVTFAPHGAKEWTVRVTPDTAAVDPHSGDVIAALSVEIARTLWGPLLRKQNGRTKTAFAHRERDLLIMDLRTLPEVRAALSQRVSSAAIDAFGLTAIEPVDGGLRLVPGLAGIPL